MGEPSLVAVTRGKTELLRGELGDEAARVEFLDVEAVGYNPARIIPVWRDFLDRTAVAGTPVRGIGEPVWPGRDKAELDECHRHESLLNLAFAGEREWTLLCPYDSNALDDDVLESARKCHPQALVDGVRAKNPVWPGSADGYSPFEGSLPVAPGDSIALAFGREDLAAVRELIGGEAALSSLRGDRRLDIVVAVNELATNSVLHGGGSGTLRVWRERGALVAEIHDRGWIEEPLAGRLRPGLAQESGRGLWMVNQLCDLVQIRSGQEGTAVRLHMNLDWASS
jgi:anti-sigma regulatory factor (Ser/Thr protein kinase)